MRSDSSSLQSRTALLSAPMAAALHSDLDLKTATAEVVARVPGRWLTSSYVSQLSLLNLTIDHLRREKHDSSGVAFKYPKIFLKVA